MKRVLYVMAGLLLSATVASAQAPAGQKVGVAARLQQGYAQIKTNLTQAADKMTDADATFKPVPEIRAFAGQFAHVAQFHYNYCSQVKGGTNPNTANLEQTATTKADAVKALADSFAYCDDAFSSLTDETAMQMIATRGGEQAKAVPLMNLIAHDNEEYGIVTVYLRLKSMVPPSTENAGRGRRGGGGGAGGGGARGRE
jgi:uncharacterized damage-inducible protein DinB